MLEKKDNKNDSSIGCLFAPFIVIILIVFLKDGCKEGIKETGKMGAYAIQFILGILFFAGFIYILWAFFINRDKRK